MIKRGLTLWSIERAGIHTEHVRRLRKSLTSEKHFALLTPHHLKLIEETFRTTPDEHQRLLAALMATAIEVYLMNHIPSELAYRIAMQTFPALLEAVEQDVQHNGLLSQLESEMIMEDTQLIDVALNSIYLYFDRATLALYASQTSSSLEDMEANTRQALTELRYAQERFLDLPLHVITSGICQFWQQETARQIEIVQQQLTSLTVNDE